MLKKNFLLDNSIYDEDSIKIAINDFEGFSIDFSKNTLNIEGQSDAEIEEIFNEFMNYVIGIKNETN